MDECSYKSVTYKKKKTLGIWQFKKVTSVPLSLDLDSKTKFRCEAPFFFVFFFVRLLVWLEVKNLRQFCSVINCIDIYIQTILWVCGTKVNKSIILINKHNTYIFS